jgi:hypothetical protein
MGTPFSPNTIALAMYLRFVHHIIYRRLSRLLLELFGLEISEGALDAAFQRGKPQFDAEVSAILARRHRTLSSSTRREYRRRLEHRLDAVMALARPTVTGIACARGTARSASTSSPFSNTPTSPQTTTAASASFHSRLPTERSPAAFDRNGALNSMPQRDRSSAPWLGAASTPSKPFCKAGPSSHRVEQLHQRH